MLQVPVATIFTTVSAAMIAGAMMWMVATMVKVEPLKDTVADHKEKIEKIEARLYRIERELPYRGDRQ